MTATIDPIQTALVVAGHFDALGVAHTIGGSIASSFAGEPRSTSDRQWRDVSAIIRVQGDRLDRKYLNDNAGILDVSDLLDRALAEASPDQ